MPVSIHGFALLELLLVCAVLLVLAWQISARFKKSSESTDLAATKLLEESLRTDLEKSGPVRFRFAGINRLETDSFSYQVQGGLPSRQVVRTPAVDGTLVERLVGIRFTLRDDRNRFLSDQPSAEEQKLVRVVEVEIRTHDAAENPALFLNDSVHGVDLDGDPSNGTAPVRLRRVFFTPILKP